MDYVGLDMYIGCFFPVFTQLKIFELLLQYLWAFTKKPVMLMEFGYLAGGAPKTKAEKRAILQRYGANSERDAKRHIAQFVGKFNKAGQDYVHRCASNGLASFVFGPDFKNHLYCEMPRLTRTRGCPHTQAGQAAFYRRLLPKLERLPFLGGMFIYCHRDDRACGICGQAECPSETQWGICDTEGKEKLGYAAVKGIWNPQ
jgi:hypothetical protein